MGAAGAWFQLAAGSGVGGVLGVSATAFQPPVLGGVGAEGVLATGFQLAAGSGDGAAGVNGASQPPVDGGAGWVLGVWFQLDAGSGAGAASGATGVCDQPADGAGVGEGVDVQPSSDDDEDGSTGRAM